jgi:hypothetical protein
VETTWERVALSLAVAVVGLFWWAVWVWFILLMRVDPSGMIIPFPGD